MFSAKCGHVAILNIAVKSNFITREFGRAKTRKKKKTHRFQYTIGQNTALECVFFCLLVCHFKFKKNERFPCCEELF